ncbi:MAG: hypothetical protein PVG69_02490, partial [Desulfobacterales bacterium]
MIDPNFIGNSAAFSAAALFVASVVATRVAVGTIPPLSLAFLRFGQGGLILLFFLFILTLSGVAVVLADRGLTWQGDNLVLVGDLLMLLTAICGAVYGV